MLRLSFSPHVVSVLALLISLGGASYSATGGPFILGRSNDATSQTRLVAPVASPALRIVNTSSSANAIGVAIATSPGRPPLAVTSSARVEKLNADLIDGIDSANLGHRRIVPFVLGPQQVSAAIEVPVNRPVFLIGAALDTEDIGVAHATLLRRPGAGLTWVGLDFAFRVVESGTGDTPGVNIVALDSGGGLFVEINDGNSIRISNVTNDTKGGAVTLLW